MNGMKVGKEAARKVARGIPLIAAALAISMAVPSAAQQTVYRWVDKDGKVHFSDTPPPPDAKSASQKSVGGGGPGEPASTSYATQVAMKRNPVTFYSSYDCGDPCNRARDLLSKRAIPYTEKDIGKSREDTEALRTLTGATDLPTLVIGAATPIKGFDTNAWHTALDGGGYPRTPLPNQVRPTPPPPKPPEPPPPKPPEPPPETAPAEGAKQ